MSMIQINGINTYYIQEGTGKDVICLLGWGQDVRMFEPTLKHLSNRFRVSVLDLPGFGKSSMMSVAWSVDDYVNWLKAFIDEMKIDEPILIAHSFGARVMII